ncbi:hypothetical protein diail_3090 [Diaporthe ilicicola]|nr:hypothetical protein diail_3090 [Diaporthe ilicicola]
MDTRTDQPHSPSARFYANRQSACPATTYDMLPYPAPEQQPNHQLVAPFNHFQGFSAPPSSHRYIDNTCATCLSDERISPRTSIPYHYHRDWESPRQRVEELSDGTDDLPSTGYGSVQHHVGGLVHTSDFRHDISKPGWTRQLSEPPNYTRPPPQCFSSPENNLAPAFAQIPVPVMRPQRGAPSGPLPAPVQYHVLGGNTIRVPSNSETSDVSQQCQFPVTTGRSLAANGTDRAASTADGDDDVNSTAYRGDSNSAASSSTVSHAEHGGAPPRALEEAAVEVHNTCLAATQRYLESLRVNWELRHGHELLTPLGLAGPTRRLRERAGARGSPYAIPRRLRRALSDNSGPEYMLGGSREGSHRGLPLKARNEEVGSVQGLQRQACPVPAPTDALLQNVSHICELVWRRACRDRDDVLGAEAGAARRMGLLVGFSETVVLYDAAEWERDAERVFYMVCEAGRNLCRELGDLEGVERLDVIETG